MDILHKFESRAEAPGQLERPLEDIAEEQVVRAVFAKEPACVFPRVSADSRQMRNVH